jgi:hypothetical protein
LSDVPRRRRWPAIPTDIIRTNDLGGLNRIIAALRERAEIFARERGRVEDSMVRVDDLLKLGLITPADLEKLRD